MYANRPDLKGDQTAFAFKVDYPNDIWDVALTYLRIGDDFDPSLGFVPRKAINSWRAGMTYAPRPSWKWLIGINTRLHWIFHPQGELFFVYNHNTFDNLDRWQMQTQQFLLKARYNFRM